MLPPQLTVLLSGIETDSSGFNGQLRYRSLSPISIDNFLSDIGPISDPMIGDNLS